MNLTPDGARYLAIGNGRRIARPFHFRWLIPTICKDSKKRWEWTARLSILSLAPLIWWYVGGLRGLAAIGLLAGFSGVVRFNLEHPVLIDAPAMALAVLAADCCRHGLWPVGVVVALLAGCTRESSPVFAAIFAWSPIPLLGLVPVVIRHFQHEGPDVLDDENRWILDHPFLASRKYHRGFGAPNWILPWGLGVLALAHPSWPLLAACVLAYGQCLVATDTVRLYQWAWPVVALCTVQAVPLRWLPVVVAVHVANPFAGPGV